MCRSLIVLVRCLPLVTLVIVTLLDNTFGSSLPDSRENSTDGSDANDGEGQLLKDEMAQLRQELHQALGQLWEEVNAKTTPNIVKRSHFVPPHHFHHYYHHHRTPLYPPSDVDATDDLSTLRELLQATQNRLRTTELTLQQTQTKLLALEDRLETEVDDQQATHSRPRSCEDKLIATQERLESAERKLTLVDETISNTEALRITVTNQGSTFVRWGRTQCPNNTQLVYAGIAGGSEHSHKGGAATRLCLTMEPEFDETADPGYSGILYGAEYQNIAGHHDHDVPCSVCRAPHSTTIMVPATLTCPQAWVTQYTGYLTADYYDHSGGSEFLCLDGDPEHMPAGHGNKNGALFYHVVTSCGSLPCPPYVNGKVVLCVVCSL